MADNPYLKIAQRDAETSVNPYIDIARQDTADQVRQSVASTASLNPDAEAKVQQLSRQYGLPPTAVRMEQPQIERKATLDAIDYELLARDNPKTAGFLSDPQKAAVARDDLDTLKELERGMGVLQATQYPSASLSNFVKGVFSSFATGGELTKQGLRTQFGDILGDQAYAQSAIKEAESARFRQSLADPAFETSTAQGLYSGAASVAQMAPGVAASIALRNPIPGLGAAGLQTETEAYTRYRARGASPLQALAGSTVEGATEIATELLPMGTIVNKLGRTGATKFLTELLVQDMAGEQIATFVQDAVDTAVANPEKSWGDFFAERPDAAYQTAIATLTAGGAITGAHVALNRMAGPELRAAQARQNAQTLEQLNALAKASKLRNRDATSFQQFIEQAAQDGPVPDVYVDPQTLAQSGVDLNALAQASPSVAAQLKEAVDTHSDIKIPVAEYMTTLAGTDTGNAILDHLKTEPGGMSRLEADTFYQTQGEQLKVEVEKILTEKQNDDVFKASRDNVYQRYLNELNAVNRHTADVNAPYALMHANFDAAMGARFGMTPEQFAEKFPRKFTSEVMGRGPSLEQPTQGPTLEELQGRWVGKDYGGVETSIYEPGNNTILLGRIEVDEDKQGQGYGTKVMQELIDYADRVGKRIELTPGTDFGGTSVTRLKKFYKRFGFVENRGRNKDFTTTEGMYREPQRRGPNTFDQEANGSTPYGEPTITINGVEKPTTNSNGQPIAATKEGLENFWRWFGDSKVVDEQGKPLVVYHGGRKGTQAFNNPDPNYRPGIFFTSSKNVADAFGKGGETYPVYLSFQNPYSLDAKGSYYSDIKRPKEMKGWALIDTIETDIAAEFAIDKGYDSAVVRNVLEGRGDEVSDVYIALKNTQIKSIYNKGQFSPTDANILNQPAYHGSPHRFEKFDLSKIGTGEGAQVQGWGIYFAERESVGRYYFESLGGAERPIQRVLIGSLSFGERDGFDYSRKAGQNTLENIRASLAEDVMIEQSAMIEAADKGKFPEFVLDILDRKIEDYKQQEWEEGVREAEKLRRLLSTPGALSVRLGEPTGNLYKLDIPDEATARMLDWDAPLNQQPQVVQDALIASGVLDQVLKTVNTQRQTLGREPFANLNDMTGKAIYQNIAAIKGSDKEASLYLDSLGIPGVKYWDGKSRADQDGHRNIVVWSQDVLDQINESVDTLYQSTDTDPDASPWYYSQVAKVVENLKMSKAPGEQWLKTIQNTPGVKQEELDWMGLSEWLAKQDGSVTKADLVAFIEANQIKVDEVVKGEPLPPMEHVVKLQDDDTYTVFDKDGNEVASGFDSRMDANDWVDEQEGVGLPEETKFGQYVLPGGENYRELLMTLPNRDPLTVEERKELNALTEQKQRSQYRDEVLALTADQVTRLNELQDKAIAGRKDNYTSSHFDEKNILAHIRFNERTDADGKRVLFVEEIQSDWHQAGRDKGYKTRELTDEELLAQYKADLIAAGMKEDMAARLSAPENIGSVRANMNLSPRAGAVPDAPFKTTWPELAFKRALRWAVDNGFDRVAWTTGAQQADRYDLSKQVDEIRYAKNDDGTYNIVPFKDGEALHDIEKENVKEGQLEDFFGKDVAKRIIEGKGDGDGAVKSLSGENLKVGGEGMRAFYDKMLPNMVNKMTKKWGGKVGETRIGEDNQPVAKAKPVPAKEELTVKETLNGLGDTTWLVVDKDGNSVIDMNFKPNSMDKGKLINLVHEKLVKDNAERNARIAQRLKEDTTAVHSLDITPEMRAAAKAGLALFQEKRGAFNPSTSTITLLKAADLSTFLHESGHFFLETMNKLALDPNAPADIKADMDTVLKWFGVGSLMEWNAMTLDQQRDNHEKFARGFEAYLFEGKAPSIEMKGIFQRFRSWLLSVYSSLKSLRVDLNDDVRKVFDRMLATSEQIKQAESLNAALPLFVTAKDAGMTEEEFKAYYATGLEATADAVDELQTRSLRDMKWLSNAKDRAVKKLQKEAEGKRAAIRKEVTAEVLAEPVNQARQFLKRGTLNLPKDASKEQRRMATEIGLNGHKLSLAVLKEMYGEEANAAWRMLPTGQYGFVVAEGGLHPDAVADMFGYGSGDEMIRDLLAAENPKEKIAGVTDQRMLERYGDLIDPQAIEQAANEAIHNDARARFIATELNALQKALGNRQILAKAARDYAAVMVNRQKVRELSPYKYTTAEARAAKASAEAFKNGDTATAAAEKKNQLVQNYAAKAANAAQERIEKGVAYLKRFERDGIRKIIDPDYVDQIVALLEQYDFKKRSLKEIDKRTSLSDWVKSQQEIGIEPDIPRSILDGLGAKSYKDMTVEEFDGLLDTVRQIEHLGRLKNKLLTAVDERDFNRAIEKSVERISEGRAKIDNRTRDSHLERLKVGVNQYLLSHRRLASLVQELDRWKDDGPVWNMLVRTANRAENKKTKMVISVNEKFEGLTRRFLEGKPRSAVAGKGVMRPGVNMVMSENERLALALNTGNAGNIQRLVGGNGFHPEQLREFLASFTPQEAQVIQEMWDLFDTLRPELGRVERALYGKEPEWVEPQPVTIGGVELRGGYAPIAYDPRMNPDVQKNVDAEDAKNMMRGARRSSSTRDGMTKTRQEDVNGKPILLTMDGIVRSLNDTIHRISFQEWAVDAMRILRSKRFSSAVNDFYGPEFLQEIERAVYDTVTDRQTRDVNDAATRLAGHLRRGVTVSALALNVKNALLNTTGFMNGAVRLGPGWMMRGMTSFYGNSPKQVLRNAREVFEKSPFMEDRVRTYNRELNEQLNLLRGERASKQWITRVGMFLDSRTRIMVDLAIYQGALMKYRAENPGADDAKLQDLAEQAVIDAASSGLAKDLPSAQRGSEWKKLFTVFIGWWVNTYQLAVRQTKQTDTKDPLSMLRLGADYFMLYSVPAAMTVLIGSLFGSGDSDDPETFARAIAREHLTAALNPFLVIREASVVIPTITGNGYDASYGGPAGLRMFSEIDKLSAQIEQGELDRALLRSAVNVGGIALHLPSGQMNRTLDGIVALSEGKTQNPLALLSGAPPKK